MATFSNKRINGFMEDADDFLNSIQKEKEIIKNNDTKEEEKEAKETASTTETTKASSKTVKPSRTNNRESIIASHKKASRHVTKAFSLEEDVFNRFHEICEKNQLRQSSIVTELIDKFNKEFE